MNGVVWQAAGVVCLGIWAYLALFRGGFWRLRQRLGRAGKTVEASITCVIPARDEVETVGKTVASLKRQLGLPKGLRIIVADDESADGTADVALRAGADTVVRVGARPPGWKGKTWAMAEGIRAEQHKPDFFLLTDADIGYISPEVVASLAAQALAGHEGEGFDLASVMVSLRCDTAAEKFLIPAFVFFFLMLYPPGWVMRRRNVAAAAGGCMLVRMEMLEKIGGMAAIRDALIDDCALAAAVKRAGGRVWLGVSDLPVVSLRGYGTAAEIRAMIARSAFAQLKHSGLLLAGTLLGMLLTYVAPVALLFSGDLLAAAMGGAAWTISAMLFLPAVGEYGAPIWTALSLPAIALVYVAATFQSALDYWRGRGGQWKGRVQDTD
jgi:hopene-associated glycosyltransferase HpnB